jgi:hypothetical protein
MKSKRGCILVEFSKKDMGILKGVAILFMLLLHLFCRKEVNGLYDSFPMIDGVPFVYYIGLFGDACVPIYLFASGYGLFLSLQKVQANIVRNTINRILKLLFNYWIILFIFIPIGYLFSKTEIFPGSITEFFLNLFILSSSYNGAWWFVQTYILLLICAPWLFKLVRNYHSIVLLLLSGSIYFIAYIQRVRQVFDLSDNTFLFMLVDAIVLIGTSQFSFIVGSIFAKERIYSRLYQKLYHMKFKNIYCSFGILSLIVFHALYESMIIAPLTAIAFICLFILMNKSKGLQTVLGFLGEHSTNIWLTHMFFYMTIFPELTFAPRYPILIFIWLLLLCIVSSYAINVIYKPILRIYEGKKSVVAYGDQAVS